MTGRQAIQTLILAPTYPPAFLGGGPPRSLEALVSYKPPNHAIRVIAPATDVDGSRLNVPTDQWQVRQNVEVIYLTGGFCLKSIRLMRQLAPQIDVLYVNSFFGWRHALLPALVARLQRFPIPVIVIAPRGELDQGALVLKPRRKTLYLALVKALVTSSRVTWHATSTREAAQIASTFGGDTKIILSENKTLNLAAERKGTWRIDPARRRLAFLSRISPKKGLDVLLGALGELPENITLDVFGPVGDVNYNRKCVELARHCSPGRVHFRGSLPPSAVVSTLENFDAMVLPTAGENFGHAIAESLAAGCPVIATDTTPWSEALRAGGGLVADDRSESAIARAIEDFFARSEKERIAMREGACEAYRQWVESRQPTDLYDKFEELVRDRPHGR